MVYTTNIPQSTDLISNSQAQILANFQFLGDTTGNAAAGYYKLPNGLIVNWGNVSFTTSGTKTINYAQAYTTTVYCVQFSLSFASSGSIVPVCIDSTTTPASLSSAKFRVNSAPPATGIIYMFAIGV